MRKLKSVQEIPHKDDKEIGFKKLIEYIKEYTFIFRNELKYLETEPEDFLQDVFNNMIRRNGYPQYDKKKNRGNFRSYVFCNCKRQQIDIARHRERLLNKLSEATGGVKKHYMVSLNQEVLNKKQDSSAELMDIIYGGSLDTSKLEVGLLLKQLPEGIISLDLPITRQKLSQLFMEGYSSKEIAKFFKIDNVYVDRLREDIGRKLWSYYDKN